MNNNTAPQGSFKEVYLKWKEKKMGNGKKIDVFFKDMVKEMKSS